MMRPALDQDDAPVLAVRDVYKTFRLHLRDGLELPVLCGVSLEVRAGQCVALVGPSGRGKSTLMKCLYGSYRVDHGELWLAQSSGHARVNLAQASPRQLIELRRSEIAYVSQFLRALPRVPAIDVVAERRLQAVDDQHGAQDAHDEPIGGDDDFDPLDETRHRQALKAAREQAGSLLARLNLPRGLWGLPPATFSGGEQQRINIARGFIEPARLLLLDEPTASLDALNRQAVIGLIDEAKRRGSAIVGIFHDEEVRDAVADRCVDLSEFSTDP